MANRQDDAAPEPIRIDDLSPDLASEAGDLLAASHADYPSFRHLFPDPHQRRRVLRPFMSAAARDAAVHARAMAAYEDDGGIAGVALWMPPGTFPLSFWRKARMAPALLQAALSARGAFHRYDPATKNTALRIANAPSCTISRTSPLQLGAALVFQRYCAAAVLDPEEALGASLISCVFACKLRCLQCGRCWDRTSVLGCCTDTVPGEVENIGGKCYDTCGT